MLVNFLSKLHREKVVKHTDTYRLFSHSENNSQLESRSNFEIPPLTLQRNMMSGKAKASGFSHRHATPQDDTICAHTQYRSAEKSVGVSDYKEENCTDRGNILKLTLSVLCVLVLSRVSRSWNQTGNKWLAMPDIGDSLNRYDLRVVESLSHLNHGNTASR